MSINFLAPETIHIMALKIKENRIYSLLLTHHYLWSGPCKPVSGWGGVFPNLGPLPFQGPPQKTIFRKAKNFSGKCWRQGGRRYFFENKSSRNLSQNNFFPEISTIFSEEIFIFKTFCNSSMPGPPRRKMARPCLRLIVDDHSYSGPGLSG